MRKVGSHTYMHVKNANSAMIVVGPAKVPRPSTMHRGLDRRGGCASYESVDEVHHLESVMHVHHHVSVWAASNMVHRSGAGARVAQTQREPFELAFSASIEGPGDYREFARKMPKVQKRKTGDLKSSVPTRRRGAKQMQRCERGDKTREREGETKRALTLRHRVDSASFTIGIAAAQGQQLLTRSSRR